MNQPLAIVIPAYKGQFLSRTLDSLVNQSLQAFHVYIGDDNSPDNIEALVAPYRDKLQFTYKKFGENRGGSDLAAHWNRCIEMSGTESWIWILPDDDVPSPECVKVFLRTVTDSKSQTSLYRFQTVHIDEEDRLIRRVPACPPLERATDFVIRKLRFERNSSVAEYIFSKQAFGATGGFLSLPLAWGSDDMLWVNLALAEGITTLPAGVVSLRQSRLNISSAGGNLTRQKFAAKYQYFSALLRNRAFMDKMAKEHSAEQFIKEMTTHLFYEYKSHEIKFTVSLLLQWAQKNNQLIGGGYVKNVYRLLRYKLKNERQRSHIAFVL